MSNRDDIRMNDYSPAGLMAAIIDVRDATALGLNNLATRVDAKIDRLRDDMNRRFDRVDEQFERLEARVGALEPHGNRPSS